MRYRDLSALLLVLMPAVWLAWSCAGEDEGSSFERLSVGTGSRALSAEPGLAVRLPAGHVVTGLAVHGEADAYAVGYLAEGPTPPYRAFVARMRDGALDTTRYFADPDDPDGVSVALDVAVGPDGSVFVVGQSTSPGFPTTDEAFLSDKPLATSAFVMRLEPDELELDWSSWLGGGVPDPRGSDFPALGVTTPTGVVVDGLGRVHVTGWTGAPDFPTTQGVIQETREGCATRLCPAVAFVTAFAPDGSSLLFSTFFGGSVDTLPRALDLDEAGSVWVTGDAPARSSLGFPWIREGFPDRGSDWESWPDDAFLARLDDLGQTLGLAIYLGTADAAPQRGTATDLDVGGDEVLVAGTAVSEVFATPEAYLTAPTGHFVSAWSLEGTKRWATYVEASTVAVSGLSAGQVGFAGAVGLEVMPDAFAGLLEDAGRELALAFTIGGSGDDRAVDLAVSADGRLWLTGNTDSGDFPFDQDGGSGPFVLALRTFEDGDGGMPDGGDGGAPDGGGAVDGGEPDAGEPDAGEPDAGEPDAGEPDAGEPDAGEPDAGEPDAGEPDAGEPDAGEPDAGPDGAPTADGGCGCASSGLTGMDVALLLGVLPLARRGRRAQRSDRA